MSGSSRTPEGRRERQAVYREVCAGEPSIPIFARAWWLDAVCGGAWDVVMETSGGQTWGALPFHVRERLGMRILTQPPLTPRLGPWIKYPHGAKYESRLSHDKKVMTALIEALPPFGRFRQLFHQSVTNWLPFYWEGFSQTARVTYCLPDLSNEEAIWDGLRGNIRREIRKARDRYEIAVRTGTVDEAITLTRSTFARQDEVMPYDEARLRRVDAACDGRNCRRVFIAEDPDGRIHAAIYLVWDELSAYYLLGGGDPELRRQGGTSACMWEAIQFASTVTLAFDFEGSMLEPIERFFRSFGAIQLPYFEVSKTPSRLARLRSALRALA